jgi:hypothetical protein
MRRDLRQQELWYASRPSASQVPKVRRAAVVTWANQTLWNVLSQHNLSERGSDTIDFSRLL